MTVARQIPHGTVNGYAHHRCRCDACRKAKRDYTHSRNYDERARSEYKRVWAEQRRHPCEQCGRPGVGYRHSICQACQRDNEAAGARQRDEVMLRMRAEGWLDYEIAREFGCSAHAIRARFTRLRQAGVSVPASPYRTRARA